MDFDSFFRARVDALHAEGRYRVFADLERRCGRFPRAFDHRIGAEVTVWCSNDYLGMGQHPAVLAAMGLTVSDAFRLLMVRVAKEKALPFAPLSPNTKTIRAMKEARKAKLKGFARVEDLMADLNAKD